jgi:hypothetical protein
LPLAMAIRFFTPGMGALSGGAPGFGIDFLVSFQK